MPTKVIKSSILFVLLLIIMQFSDIHAWENTFQIINIEKLSRYNEDRVMYQQVEKAVSENVDNSVASLMIIKDSKIYLFKDGYDSSVDVGNQRMILSMENRLIPDLWTNKIDNNPDFIQVTDRRVELMKNITQDFVTKNFGEFYLKVRDEFLKKHVQIFNELMVNRKNTGLYVEHYPLPKRVYDTGPTKYFISVTAKTMDEKIYYAEDADGDGITETFAATIPDGFHWGYKSGPNIIFIYNNSREEIKSLIGKLTNNAYFGTPEEEKNIKDTFPKSDEITEMINDIYKTVIRN